MAGREAGRKALQLSMFNGKTRAGRLGLLRHTEHILKSGLVEEPVWFQAMKAAPPLPREPAGGRPPMIEFAEDKLVTEFLRRNEPIQSMPVDLNSVEPHIALKFAWRQLELMEGGMEQEEAYESVKTEMTSKLGGAAADALAKGGSHTPKSSPSVLGLLQAQEEVILQTRGLFSETSAVPTIKPTPSRGGTAGFGSSNQ